MPRIKMRSVALRLSAAIAGGALLVSGVTVPAEAGNKKFTVKKADLAVHSFSSKPGVPTGSIRLNCSPTWRVTEPAKGKYNWGPMDASVKQAEQWGIKDILFVFCGAPAWASRTEPHPDYSKQGFGLGSTGAPKKLKYWKNFVKHVVKRYKGRIDAYQIWNEVTSWQFYQGTPKQMATMTKSGSSIIRKYGGGARVVAPSVQTHQPVYYSRFAIPFFKQMDAINWPVDVASGHFYPTGTGGPDQRIRQINMFTSDVHKYGYPTSKQLWDTEANFATTVGVNNPPAGRVSGPTAAIYLARDYLDSWRTGLRRSYWYMWSTDYVPFAGVQLRPGDPATAAFNTLGSWVIGAKYRGCSTSGKLVNCSFKKSSGNFTIAFTTSGSAKLAISGTKSVCPVYGGGCVSASKSTSVGTMPVKVG